MARELWMDPTRARHVGVQVAQTSGPLRNQTDICGGNMGGRS